MKNVKLKEKIRSRLASLKKMGNVDLNVKDLKKMTSFYSEILGLEIIKNEKDLIVLGKKSLPLITLHKMEDLFSADPSEAGLYHFAILFSSRGDLARTVKGIFKRTPQLFSGSADHLVSEAFYFYDPEGNGIELYYDRDRSHWEWINGQVKMTTLYLDPIEYITRFQEVRDKEPAVTMGHVHLKVGNIEIAKEFYVNILGFDITAELPGALFISVGGYHHHLAMNTWESNGAEERKKSLGLKRYTLLVSDKQDFIDLFNRLNENSIEFKEESGVLLFFDPWKNQIKVEISD